MPLATAATCATVSSGDSAFASSSRAFMLADTRSAVSCSASPNPSSSASFLFLSVLYSYATTTASDPTAAPRDATDSFPFHRFL